MIPVVQVADRKQFVALSQPRTVATQPHRTHTGLDRVSQLDAGVTTYHGDTEHTKTHREILEIFSVHLRGLCGSVVNVTSEPLEPYLMMPVVIAGIPFSIALMFSI